MPTFRYQNDGMPDYLRSAARRNLATEDSTISAFNNRVKYFPMATDTKPAMNGQPPEQSGFKFSGIGGPVDTSIGAPVPNSFVQTTVANTAPSTNGVTSGGWRFDSFGPSQLNGSSAPNMDKAYGQQVSPVVTPANLTGTGTPSPVIPADYQPKDVTDLQKKYGWGSGAGGATNESSGRTPIDQYHPIQVLHERTLDSFRTPISGFNKIQGDTSYTLTS